MILFQSVFDGSHIGVSALTAAITLSLVKTVDYLVRKNGKNGNGNGTQLCKAEACLAVGMEDRIQEYHTENRGVLRDIRDDIRTLVLLSRENNGRNR